jgi:hypothetical protein
VETPSQFSYDPIQSMIEIKLQLVIDIFITETNIVEVLICPRYANVNDRFEFYFYEGLNWIVRKL